VVSLGSREQFVLRVPSTPALLVLNLNAALSAARSKQVVVHQHRR
jgi:hypothetical protein